jgi:hypothetical protein
MGAGRPTIYSEDLAKEICHWISQGKSLRAYCRQDNTPSYATIMNWVVGNPEFIEHYVQARDAAGHAHADGIIDVVEHVFAGKLDPQSAKAIMDGMKWAAERMAPKSFSPRQSVDMNASFNVTIEGDDAKL